MYKHVKDIDENGKCGQVGTGTNINFYKSIGMVERDVEQSEVDGQWYLSEKCPHLTSEEKETQEKKEEYTSRISELKSFLTETDYIVIKIAEGEATKEEYSEVLEKRKSARTEINELQTELENL